MAVTISSGGEIRFGVLSPFGLRRSSTYKVWAPRNKDDVYLACRHIDGSRFHVSLHASGQWSFKFSHVSQLGAYRVERTSWERPRDLEPGLTRAFAVVIPAAGATIPINDAVKPQRVRWVATTDSAVLGMEFNVFLIAAGVRYQGWPGQRAMGTLPIGTFPLASGGHVWVVSHALTQLPSPNGGRVTFPGPPEGKEVVLRRLRADPDRRFRLLLLGYDDDGARWLIEGPLTAA